MLKTYLYIPDDLNKEVGALALEKKSSKAGILRDALVRGIEQLKKQRGGSAEILLKIGKIAEASGVRGPKDLSEKMDEYLWKDYEKDFSRRRR